MLTCHPKCLRSGAGYLHADQLACRTASMRARSGVMLLSCKVMSQPMREINCMGLQGTEMQATLHIRGALAAILGSKLPGFSKR